jgi:phage baseplate assembly protein W
MPNFQTFKDLNITFKPHPITGDLTVVKDEAAIKQAMINLLLTNKGERFFDSRIGSSLSNLLFETLDFATAALINSEVENTIKFYEPRVNILSISTVPNFDENGFDIELVFEVTGREDFPTSINFFLERTR